MWVTIAGFLWFGVPEKNQSGHRSILGIDLLFLVDINGVFAIINLLWEASTFHLWFRVPLKDQRDRDPFH
jgi:hypothetical protein